MTVSLDTDADIYLAGQKAPAGTYRQIDCEREVVLDKEDVLPGSLDGKVACYARVPPVVTVSAIVRAVRSTRE